jgi:ubiquinone/menaquinone biosynthesis C-methylase UbiE
MLERLGRRFAVRQGRSCAAAALALFRWLTRAVQPDRAAWVSGGRPRRCSLEAALDALDVSPKRALDLGTGTGRAAFLLAQRYPEAEVVGVDLAEDMLAEARKLTPPELADRVRFEQADAERLSYPDGSFDLVSLANMIPFFEELARVTTPGGAVVFSFSAGPETPIYVPPDVLRERLSEHGLAEFADFAAGNGTALSARKGGGA